MPFKIVRNDITKVKADVIVNTANPNPICASGTDLAIYEAAGKEKLLAERANIGKIARGDIAVTGAYNLKAKYIIHTVVPKWYDESEKNQNELLEECYKNIFRISADYDIKSISIPTLGIGACSAPVDVAVKIAIDGIINNFFRNPDIDKIYIVCNDSRIQRTYIEYLNSLLD